MESGEKGVVFNRHILEQEELAAGEKGIAITCNGKTRIFSGVATAGDKGKVITYLGKRWFIKPSGEADHGTWAAFSFWARWIQSFCQNGNEMWVLGGVHERVTGSYSMDMSSPWYSEDYGKTWTILYQPTGWMQEGIDKWLYGFKLYYDGTYLWTISGRVEGGGVNVKGVYRSPDKGATWSHVGDYSPPGTYAAVWEVLNGKMYQISGFTDAGGYVKKVYSCPLGGDFLTWDTLADVPWPTGRSNTASIVWDGKIWIIGGLHSGGEDKDVWSFDGTSWVQELADPPWGTTYGNSLIQVKISGIEVFVHFVGRENGVTLAVPKIFWSIDMVTWFMMNPIPVQATGDHDPTWHYQNYRSLGRGEDGRLLIFFGLYMTVGLETWCYHKNYYVKRFPD